MGTPTKLSEMSSDYLKPYFVAHSFTFGSGTTTSDWKIPVDLLFAKMRGFISVQSNGDFIEVKVVDVDNILGQGSGAVLAHPVRKYFVNPVAYTPEDFSREYPTKVLANLYLRFIYTATGLLPSGTVRLNFLANEII